MRLRSKRLPRDDMARVLAAHLKPCSRGDPALLPPRGRKPSPAREWVRGSFLCTARQRNPSLCERARISCSDPTCRSQNHPEILNTGVLQRSGLRHGQVLQVAVRSPGVQARLVSVDAKVAEDALRSH
eukprot:scaffold1687_cov405-Prasinococcus_capsulatus_cf.AAC.22